MAGLVLVAILNHSQVGRDILGGLMLFGFVLLGVYFWWAE